MTARNSKSISIIGAGKIGLALATLWSKKGHAICLGSRNPEKHRLIVEALGLSVDIQPVIDAVIESDIVVLAVPYSQVAGLIAQIKNNLRGKTIIDATNPFALSEQGHVISTLGPDITEGSYMASLLPESNIIRAFTHIMDELLVSRGTGQPGLFAMAISGDDEASKIVVSDLVIDAGFVPVDIGNLSESAPLDPGGILFPHVFTKADMELVLDRAQH